ncbi:MAG: hypothetical protein U1E53_19885 [Dongiaceae bacterium]
MRQPPARIPRRTDEGSFLNEVWRLFLFSRVLHLPPPRERDRR